MHPTPTPNAAFGTHHCHFRNYWETRNACSAHDYSLIVYWIWHLLFKETILPFEPSCKMRTAQNTNWHSELVHSVLSRQKHLAATVYLWMVCGTMFTVRIWLSLVWSKMVKTSLNKIYFTPDYPWETFWLHLQAFEYSMQNSLLTVEFYTMQVHAPFIHLRLVTNLWAVQQCTLGVHGLSHWAFMAICFFVYNICVANFMCVATLWWRLQ